LRNLVRLCEQARHPDGRQTTGAEAYAVYGRESRPVFVRIGGRIVWPRCHRFPRSTKSSLEQSIEHKETGDQNHVLRQREAEIADQEDNE
jgi:hypothetical protein